MKKIEKGLAFTLSSIILLLDGENKKEKVGKRKYRGKNT